MNWDGVIFEKNNRDCIYIAILYIRALKQARYGRHALNYFFLKKKKFRLTCLLHILDFTTSFLLINFAIVSIMNLQYYIE